MKGANDMIWYAFPHAMGLRGVIATAAAVESVIKVAVPQSLAAWLKSQGEQK